MKLRLDENLGRRCVGLLTSAGHDVATVFDQHLSGASDSLLSDVCRRERRCLVSLDLDFANPLRFQPASYPGIAVIRLPARPGVDDLVNAVKTLINALEKETIEGRLWIVETGRLRIYRPEQS
jgi:predicted nuclease of predicted toxin-antitoxin system